MKTLLRYTLLMAMGLCLVAASVHAQPVIEPNITVQPDPSVAANLTAFRPFGPGTTGNTKDANGNIEPKPFEVEPAGFGSIKNDTTLTITDLQFTITGPEGAKWGDVDGDGKTGTPAGGIFNMSAINGATLTLTGGSIPPGGAFKPLFKTNPAEDAGVILLASYSVAEPSTMLLLGFGLVGILRFRRTSRR